MHFAALAMAMAAATLGDELYLHTFYSPNVGDYWACCPFEKCRSLALPPRNDMAIFPFSSGKVQIVKMSKCKIISSPL